MALQKMKILAYQDNTYTTKASKGTYYAVINPKNWSESFSVQLGKSTPLGAPTTERKFLGIKPSSIDVNLFFDGTGLVSTISKSEKSKSVWDQIQDLKGVVYKMDGDSHQPNYLRLIWGKMRFQGRVETLNVEYSLIDPNGNPIRANVKLNLSSAENLKTAEQRVKKNSPDMTHILKTDSGSVLPLMCNDVYKRPEMYIKVARRNDLDQFRRLPEGVSLTFPPVEKGS